MLFFSKTKKYLKSLITSNNGESSKSFFLVTVTIMGIYLLFICGFAILIDVICNGYILTDLYGMSTLIAAIASLFGAAGWTKVAGEKNLNNNQKYYRTIENDNNDSDEICIKPSSDDIEKALK